MPSPDAIAHFSAKAERALQLVTDYYLDQARQESNLDALPEVLATIRNSFSCRVFAEELPMETYWDLCPYLPRAEYEPELTDAEQAGAALIALAQQRALAQLHALLSTTDCDLQDHSLQAELPDHELLRSGDRVEIRDPHSEFYGHRAIFLFYTDPRIGHHARKALVQVEDVPQAPMPLSPAQLCFVPDETDFEHRYELLRIWSNDDFELRLFDLHRTSIQLGKPLLAYELIDRRFGGQPEQIFSGADFAVSPLHAIDSDATAAAVLSFLSLQQGDTDASYFETYSPYQLRWRDERAPDLAEWARHLQERATWRRHFESGDLLAVVEAIARQGTVDDLCAVLESDISEACAAVGELEVDESDLVTCRFLERVYLAQREELDVFAAAAPSASISVLAPASSASADSASALSS